MKSTLSVGILSFLAVWPIAARADSPLAEYRLDKLNQRLCGQVVDHTNHHGADRRIWSEALCSRRNLYVYLPPCFDPSRKYPLLIWLHGYTEDERAGAHRVFPYFDRAIADGRLPPAIVIAPDGSIPMKWPGSMFLNNCFGRYEDYLIQDVIPFVEEHYPICADRRCHALIGLSSGGWAAYTLAIRHRHYFGIVAGILPLLNPRWVDCHGRYRRNFDPCCWGWRCELVKKREIVGVWYGLPVTMYQMTGQYFGWGPCGLARLSKENPIENLDHHDVQPGELLMYIGYNRRDELNADAQIESFLCRAQQRGLCVTVDCNTRGGTHTVASGLTFLDRMNVWLGCQLRSAGCDGPLPEPEVHILNTTTAENDLAIEGK